MEGHADGVYDVAFDSSEERALSGSRDGTIRLWDLETGGCDRVFKGHTYHVHNVLWSADRSRILSTSSDIRLWEVQSGRCLRVFKQDHTGTIRKLVCGVPMNVVQSRPGTTARCVSGMSRTVAACAYSKDTPSEW